MHSIIIITLLFIPLLLLYQKAAVPYFVATIQHTLIGDFFTGRGIQLFWPLTVTWFGAAVSHGSMLNILSEWIFSVFSLVMMFKLGDLRKILAPHPSNFALVVPLISIISPLFLGFPVPVPLGLYFPHIVYSVVFTLSLLDDCRGLMKKAK